MRSSRSRQFASFRRSSATLAVVAAVFVSDLALAQAQGNQSATSPQGQPTFEAVSVKRNMSGARQSYLRWEPGGFTAQNQVLRTLIVLGYRLFTFQLEGGPGWVGSARFDVTARLSAPARTLDQRAVLLRTTLEDRFGLKLKMELRERRRYALVMARPDGSLGPELQRSTVAADCDVIGDEQPALPPINDPKLPPCSALGSLAGMVASGVRISDFARMISQQVGTMVVDRTNLTGLFDFTLKSQGAVLGAAGRPTDDRPSLFVALEEQLGLKLVSERGEVPIYVVEQVHELTPD